MAEKKANGAYQQLRKDIAAGTLGTVYIFHGEETYLREYYLDQAVKKLVPAGMEEFNYHKLEGKGLTVQTLTELVEAMPMLSERTVIQVVDFDIFKLNDEQRKALVALLEKGKCVKTYFSAYEQKAIREKLKAIAASPEGKLAGELIGCVENMIAIGTGLIAVYS